MADEGIQNVLNSLRRQRDEIDEKLAGMNKLLQDRDTLQHAIVGLEEVLRLESGNPSELPLWQGARQVLLQNRVPMTVRQLVEALAAMGWKLEGKTPIESLRTTLIRKPETFERLPNGRFSLRTSTAARMPELLAPAASQTALSSMTGKGPYAED